MQKTKKEASPRGRKLIIANWKMNPKTSSEALRVLKASKEALSLTKYVDVVVCAPSLFTGLITKGAKKKSLSFGLQNIHSETEGAFTGELSADMGKSLGVTFSIVGHSERRALGENNEFVAKKVAQLLKNGMTPILCVGENERDEHGHYLEVLKQELLGSLIGISKKAISKIVIAYEPIWAIGKTGSEAMDAHGLHQTALFIRKVLIDNFGNDAQEVRVLYGGSVAPENAGSLVKNGEVDGLLVGHQSLVAKNFKQILSEVDKNA